MILDLRERMFGVFALLLFTKPLIPIAVQHGAISVDTGLLQGRWATGQNNFVIQILFAVTYVIAFLLIGRRGFFAWITKDRLLLPLLILALVSIFWSEDPAITFTRATSLLGTVIVGIYLADRYSFRELIKLLAWSLGLAVLLSVFAVIVRPSYAIMSDVHEGAWRGIYVHKNVLGRFASLGVISFLMVATSFPRYRHIGWGGFLLSALVVLKSASLTASLVLVILLFLVPVFLAMRRHPLLVPGLAVGLLAVVSMGVWLTDSSSDLLKDLGRDSTLTGRVDLWESAAMVIQKSPWIGHGYGTARVGEGDDASTYLARFSQWNAPDAHNGFLNLTLDLGVVGLALFIAGFVAAFGRAIAYLRENRGVEALWPLVFFGFILLTNMTETVLLKNNNLDWVLYVATVLSVAKSRKPASAEAGTSISR